MKKWTGVNYDNKQVPKSILLQGQTNFFTRAVLIFIILIGVSLGVTHSLHAQETVDPRSGRLFLTETDLILPGGIGPTPPPPGGTGSTTTPSGKTTTSGTTLPPTTTGISGSSNPPPTTSSTTTSSTVSAKAVTDESKGYVYYTGTPGMLCKLNMSKTTKEYLDNSKRIPIVAPCNSEKEALQVLYGKKWG